ncbi:MAG: Malonyl CoA-acyl carrier protein transacylase [Candidatus Anoxychlamydiales bacterium]|nr:Malonyl CoA-acyl carrier protein transacylase [Candidatus Anoxychlamydiales bacterium]NGX40559.1 Malonyl CoA-acyl carrier protein transacylase [Candidatus Anoxychlamydiales bacterium]HEU64181.1 [acyl-carrier-protein] S-malonyltransferase [Chlamydiota bacterium]
MKNIAFIFPGQGSQKVLMGKDFYDNFKVAKEIFDKANSLLNYKLTDIMFNGPKEKLDLTQNSQLALFVNSIAILKVLQDKYPNIQPKICAGLSLGEYSALYASKKLSFEELIFLIQKRAKFMDEACQINTGAMAAIINLNIDEIKDVIKGFEDVWIANINTENQIVISGKKESVEKACIALKDKGAKRALLLDVQGAFHTPYMKSAENNLKNEILQADFIDSEIEIVMNVTAKEPQDASNLKTNLIKQISSTIKWAESIKEMDEKIDLFIEIGSKALTNMNRKIGVKAKCIAIEKITDLKELDNAFEK